ncbi:autotransporter outer membrane beta-barrel domain-containing protein [Escherichia coli]|nr:autotransporter outer membrane beta-barrel domain-containing protein [Escherichia coli]
MESKLVDTRSIYRELGATLSYNMRLGNGMEVEPRLKAAVRKEFVDDNRVKVNNEIAGLSSPSIPILTIRLFTQPGINILFCVGGNGIKVQMGRANSNE